MEHELQDTDFLVSQTDSKGKILFANEDFCKIAGYTLEEMIGKPHNIVRHPDMPKAAFKDLWDTVKSGKDTLKIPPKTAGIIGYLRPFILISRAVKAITAICPADGKLPKRKSKKPKHFIKLCDKRG